MKVLLFLLAFAPSASAAGNDIFRPVQYSEAAGRDRALLTLDRVAFKRLLEKAQKGDPYNFFLPGGPVELRFDYRVTDASKDLDCCSIALSSARGDAIVRLDHQLEVRDFSLHFDGQEYRYRPTGNGNFEVFGPRAAVLAPETFR